MSSQSQIDQYQRKQSQKDYNNYLMSGNNEDAKSNKNLVLNKGRSNNNLNENSDKEDDFFEEPENQRAIPSSSRTFLVWFLLTPWATELRPFVFTWRPSWGISLFWLPTSI